MSYPDRADYTELAADRDRLAADRDHTRGLLDQARADRGKALDHARAVEAERDRLAADLEGAELRLSYVTGEVEHLREQLDQAGELLAAADTSRAVDGARIRAAEAVLDDPRHASAGPRALETRIRAALRGDDQ